MPIPEPTPLALIARAIDVGQTGMADKLMELAERQDAREERMRALDARAAYNAAIAAAKGEIPVIEKNRTVSHGTGKASYRHEDLASIARVVDPILAKYGLYYTYDAKTSPGRVEVSTILGHAAGYERPPVVLDAAPDTSGAKNSIQALGSALTYLQRYGLKLALGLAASEDDDGRAAGAAAGPISEEQVEQLQKLLMETLPKDVEIGVYTGRFCTRVGVGSLAEITTDRFENARSVIEDKRKTAA